MPPAFIKRKCSGGSAAVAKAVEAVKLFRFWNLERFVDQRQHGLIRLMEDYHVDFVHRPVSGGQGLLDNLRNLIDTEVKDRRPIHEKVFRSADAAGIISRFQRSFRAVWKPCSACWNDQVSRSATVSAKRKVFKTKPLFARSDKGGASCIAMERNQASITGVQQAGDGVGIEQQHAPSNSTCDQRMRHTQAIGEGTARLIDVESGAGLRQA